MGLTDEQHDHRVFRIERELADAKAAKTFFEAARCISEALYLFPGSPSTRLAGNDRDRLLNAIDELAADVVRWKGFYRVVQFRAGLSAAATLVTWWSENGDDQAAYGDRIDDARSYVRMLQNDMHNACLHNEITERAHRRRSSVVSDLLHQGLPKNRTGSGSRGR